MSVYFITAREVGRVKIGYSIDPQKRFTKMRTDSPVTLALERVCDGDRSDERRLHWRFSEHRSAGEWFTLSASIEEHMATLPTFPGKKVRKPFAGDPNSLGNIIEIRRALGVSQTEMAERLGLVQSSVSRFERGDLVTDKRTLLAARALLGLSA